MSQLVPTNGKSMSMAQRLFAASAPKSRVTYYNHRRIQEFGEYLKIIWPEPRKEGETSGTIRTEFRDELPVVRDFDGQYITHRFIAVEGDIVELQVGNLMLNRETAEDSSESKVRCRTFKAEYETEEGTVTNMAELPFNFPYYSVREYGEDSTYNTQLENAGVELWGRMDADLAKRDDQPVERRCSECVRNGWSVIPKVDDFGQPVQKDGQSLADRCSTKIQLVMLVRKVAFINTEGVLDWRPVENLGVDTVKGPFIVVISNLGPRDVRWMDPSNLDRKSSPYVPTSVLPLKFYLQNVYNKYAPEGLVTTAEVPELGHRDIIGVPTQMWLVPTVEKLVGGRTRMPMFCEANSLDYALEHGMARALYAWEMYGYERAVANGSEGIERPQETGYTDEPVSTSTATLETHALPMAEDPESFEDSLSSPDGGDDPFLDTELDPDHPAAFPVTSPPNFRSTRKK